MSFVLRVFRLKVQNDGHVSRPGFGCDRVVSEHWVMILMGICLVYIGNR